MYKQWFQIQCYIFSLLENIIYSNFSLIPKVTVYYLEKYAYFNMSFITVMVQENNAKPGKGSINFIFYWMICGMTNTIDLY